MLEVSSNPVFQSSLSTDCTRYDSVPHFVVHGGVELPATEKDQIKIPAVWLIDQAGFKAKTLNKVRCHPTPLVLTNLGGATGNDVITMAKDIIASVQGKFGIQLEPEVRLLGSKGLISL